MKNIKISLILNIIIVLLVSIGTIFMFNGIEFMSNTKILESTGFGAFKFYTVDSNVLVAIGSFILIINEILVLNNKKKEIPKYSYLLKYIGTVAVTLTFLVTALWLAPLMKNNFLFLYMNNNLFFHLIVPLLSFISYCFFEKNNMKFKYVFIGLSTVIIYGIFYIANILSHIENGKVLPGYDFYGFVIGGTNTMYIPLLVLLLITYVISIVIYKINKKTS